jgi:hypothetical protein
VITHLVITVPIIVYIMAGYFETVPRELEEAALIDGASVWRTFLHVALPLARPGIVVGTILAFIFSWNNFVFGRARRPRDTHAAGRRIQRVDVRAARLGPARGGGDHRHAACAAAHHRHPERNSSLGLTAGGVKGG